MIARNTLLLSFARAMGLGDPALAAGDAARGQTSYAAACQRCHASVARIARRIPGGTPEQKQAWLDRFLAGHHAPEPAVRADIAAYLLAQ